MKLLIIGHSVEDHIYSSGRQEIKPGGIFYTASALANYKEKEDELFLCTAVARENYKLFSSVYDLLKKDYIIFVDRIPTVHLKLYNDKEREEVYENITENLSVDLHNLNSFYGILINMITGYDINLEQLKSIRANYKGLIYFDVHTLSRGMDKTGKRDFRPIPGFEKWAANIDMLQANETELMTLSKKSGEVEIVKELISFGIKYIIVTKGKYGARIYGKDNKGELISVFKSSLTVNTNNKVGCGDVFGAIFFYEYIKNENIFTALERANKAAGISASFTDLNEFKDLNNNVLARIS